MKKDVTAVILCGGKSVRAGMDKQKFKVNGKLIAVNIAQKLNKVFDNIIIVTNTPQIYANESRRIVTDIYKGCGPMGGVHAGLKASKSSYIYVTACDMPYVNTEYIQYCMGKLQSKKVGIDALVFKHSDGFVEPFNGFYSKTCLGKIEKLIKEKQYKLMTLLNSINTDYVNENEVKLISDIDKMFVNLNYKEEIEEYICNAK